MIRASILLWLVLIAGAGGALYHLKYRVIALEEELAEVRGDTGANRAAIAMLHAEWSYLNDPGQIEAYAAQHLGTRPTTVHDIVALADIPLAAGAQVRAPIDTGPSDVLPPALAPERDRAPDLLPPPIAADDENGLLVAEAEAAAAADLALVPAGRAAPPPPTAVAGPQDAIGSLIANVLHEPSPGAVMASFPRTVQP